ncbi:MAG TPA: hypothetical protein VF121_19620 [Thermoanaerobaculia bacterium]|nr:hypothetical protein [Thermoanaerobaculia bacterium]
MDERVAKLDTPEACEQFARNVEARGKPDLALEARKRAVQLEAAKHQVNTAAEREALEAVFAYERALHEKHGKRVRASRTWPMIKERGIIATVEHLVTRRDETMGYKAVIEMGMPEIAFEAVVLRHPHLFSDRAVQRSRERLDALKEAE